MNIDKEFMRWAKKKDPYCLYIGFTSMAYYYKERLEEETDPVKKEIYTEKYKMAFKESQKYDELWRKKVRPFVKHSFRK